MDKSKELSMQSPPEAIWSWVLSAHFRKKDVQNFLPRRTNGNEGYKGLRSFFQSKLVVERVSTQWAHESSPVWKDRQFGVAISETVLHTLAYLATDLEYELNGIRRGQFPDLTREKMEIMFTQSTLLGKYFQKVKFK